METYRLGDHTTADNASRYRPDEEVSAAWKEDPIARLRTYLSARSCGTRVRKKPFWRTWVGESKGQQIPILPSRSLGLWK